MEAGHHPDLLFGTSAGALNAAHLAADPTLEGVASLAVLWTSVRRRDVFPVHPGRVVAGLLGTRDSMFSASALTRWLRSTTALRRLEDRALPLTVVATDLETGEEVGLESGPAVPALAASSAMPGIFPPVRIGDRWLIDGSVASDTPVRGRRQGPGLTPRSGCYPASPPYPCSGPGPAIDVMLRSVSITLAHVHGDRSGDLGGQVRAVHGPCPCRARRLPVQLRSKATSS